jgi:ketosteroid isomerase-like protein/CheY-like chemotaxis protein
VNASAKILLVEDHHDQALLVLEVLGEHGFDVEWVRTVSEGAVRLAAHPFRLVLTDYITGPAAEAAHAAHQLLDVAGAVPVVCISAWRFSTRELVDRFAFVLYKPFVPDELLAVVANLVSVEQRPHETAQVRRYFEALSRKDWDTLGTLCTDDVQYRVPQAGSNQPQVVIGRANFTAMARETFSAFPDASFEVTEVAALPRGAVARYTGRWTLPTKEVASMDAAVTFSFAAGQISNIGVRLDDQHLRAIAEGH